MPERGAVLQWLLVVCCMIPCLQSSGSQMARKRRHWSNKEHEVPDEQRLLTELLDGYHQYSRPVFNASEKVTIKFGLTLVQISDMDEVNQVLTINVWLEQEWEDERLTWDPKDYNGLEILRIPCEKLWLPDIVLYNSADDFTTGYMKSKAMVHYTGNVFWPPPAKFRSSCKIDITYFPFDDQVCELKFGSWTYDGFQVDVTNRSATVDLENYVFSGEWELIDVQIRRTEVYYACCAEPYPDVRFTIIIRRKTLYYLFNIIFPCLWLTILSLLGFWLPPDSGEKITLGITVLLAFSVFMLLIAESMPATSEFVPLIGIYLTVTMAMTSLSIILTVFVLQLHHVGPHQKRVPRWMWTLVIEVLAPVVCLCHVSQRYRYVSLQKAARRDSRRQQKRHQGDGGGGGGEIQGNMHGDIHMSTLAAGQTGGEIIFRGDGGGGGRVIDGTRRNCNGIIIAGGGVAGGGNIGRGRGFEGGGADLSPGHGRGDGAATDRQSDGERFCDRGVDACDGGEDVHGKSYEERSESSFVEPHPLETSFQRVWFDETRSESGGRGSWMNSSGSGASESGVGVSSIMSSNRTSMSSRQPTSARSNEQFSSRGLARRDPISRPGEYISTARYSRSSQSSQRKHDRLSYDSDASFPESSSQTQQGHGESAIGTSVITSSCSESQYQTPPKLSESSDSYVAGYSVRDTSNYGGDLPSHEERVPPPQFPYTTQGKSVHYQTEREVGDEQWKDPLYQKSVDMQYTDPRQQQGGDLSFRDGQDQGVEYRRHEAVAHNHNRDSIRGQAPPGYNDPRYHPSQHRGGPAGGSSQFPNVRYHGGPADGSGRQPSSQRADDQIQQHLQVLVSQDEDEEYHQDVVTEWRVVAHVMDRLLFWLFLFVAVASSVIILIVKPLTKPEPWRNLPNGTIHR